MMESPDDDIFILTNQDTLDGSVGDSTTGLQPQDFVISRAVAGARPDPAVQALQQAYSNLKKRYNETVQKNQHISRALRDVRKLKQSDIEMASYGNARDNLGGGAQGAAATGEHVCNDDDIRAQMGYIKYLEREKVTNEAKLQQMASMNASFEAMQKKMRETVSLLQRKEDDLKRAHETIKSLKEENIELRQGKNMLQRHSLDLQDHGRTSVLESSLEKQSKEFEQLEIRHKDLQRELDSCKKECDRLNVSEELAKMELQTSNKKLEDCEHRYSILMEEYNKLKEELRSLDFPAGSSMPTAQEMEYLKKVIADLRRTVLQQRDFLSKLGKSSLMEGVKSDLIPVISKSEGGSGLEFHAKNIQMLPPSTRSNLCVPDSANMLSPRRNRLSDSSIKMGSTAKDNVSNLHSRSEVLRRKSTPTPTSPRSKSEVIAKTPEYQPGNQQYFPPSANQIVNPYHMNGGTTHCQSLYDDIPAPDRRRVPEAVQCDSFDMVQDLTPAFPVPPELRQSASRVGDTRTDENRTQETSNDTAPEEKICPVCSRDFSTMPIEDFQTHVFECFDDHSAPETLRANSQPERICPMCNALFPEAVSQDEFERHVQTHFEENITDRFEIIHP